MPKSYNCDNCGNTYYSENYVKYKHRSECLSSKLRRSWKSQEEYTTCETCGKKFTNLKLHKNHCQKYSCQYCKKSFSSSKSLYDHQKLDFFEYIENKEELVFKFCCKTCNFSCKNKDQFSNHYRNSDQKLKLECLEGGFKVTLDLYDKDKHKAKGRNGYWCDECGEKFVRQKYLLDHKKEIHDFEGKDLLLKCPKCDFASKNSVELQNHFKNMHVDDPLKIFKCDPCGESYFFKNALINHQKRSHFTDKNDKKWYVCEVCEKRYDSSQALKGHTREVHLEIKKSDNFPTLKCEICLMTYKGSRALEEHVKTQHSEYTPMFHCNICDYKAPQECRLKYHQARKHMSNKPYGCSQCSYKAAHKVLIKQHFHYKHQKQEEVNCDICKKTFQKRSYRSHTKICHNDLKPFQCNLCEFATKLKPRLETHQNNKHFKLSDHKCETCGRTFRMKMSMERHIKVIHEKEKRIVIKCESCAFSTIHRSSMNRHIKSHHKAKESTATKCPICNMSLKTESNLKLHVKRIHEDKNLICLKCEYSTNFKTDLLKHYQNKHVEQ